MSQYNLPEELLAKHKKPWMTWCLVVLLVIGIGAWLIGPKATEQIRSFIAVHYAEKAEKLIEQSEWAQANTALTLASQWHAENPKVLRVVADFLIAVNGSPASTLQALRRIEASGQAEEKDYIRMGQIYIQQEDITNTLATLDKLTPEARQKRPAQELVANILRLQGRSQEAEKTLRHALSLDKDDPVCRFRLAIMDQQAAFAEMRQQGRETLMNLTAGKDQAALMAIDFLVKDSSLTSVEADLLFQRIESHPDKTEEARFTVLSALMRVRPQKRDEILSAEIVRHEKKGAEQMAPVLYWLLREKEPERVLAMRPREIFTKSQILIEPYLQALGALDRWQELDKTLSKPAGMPISSGYIALWRARAGRHMDRDTTSTRQHLNVVYEACGHGRDEATARAGATIAEEANLYDVAAQFYEGLAEHQPQVKVPMLEKVYEMAMRGRDTDRVMKVSEELQSLRPENPLYADRVLYLHLVSGSELEIHLQKTAQIKADATDRVEDHFHLALAAYRMGDLSTLRLHLSHLPDVSSLPPGQRAVHAGLLSISGQVGPAYLIAEQIPSLLLLKEEKRFLDRAL